MKSTVTGVDDQDFIPRRRAGDLDETVPFDNGDIRHEPTDAQLRELDLNPTDNTTGDQEPPDIPRYEESKSAFRDGGG